LVHIASISYPLHTDRWKTTCYLQCWQTYARQLQLVPEHCTSRQHTFTAYTAAYDPSLNTVCMCTGA